jgi:hypothetical protein
MPGTKPGGGGGTNPGGATTGGLNPPPANAIGGGGGHTPVNPAGRGSGMGMPSPPNATGGGGTWPANGAGTPKAGGRASADGARWYCSFAARRGGDERGDGERLLARRRWRGGERDEGERGRRWGPRLAERAAEGERERDPALRRPRLRLRPREEE